MKTIVVANQKGGVGKTTVARHLAFYGIEQGLRVLAVDLDIQGNFSSTFKNMQAENGLVPGGAEDEGATEAEPAVLVSSGIFQPDDGTAPAMCGERIAYVEADPGILAVEHQDLEQLIESAQARFASLSESFDVCVIDTGPSVSKLLVGALAVADFAVSPCEADSDAIKGLAGFFSNVVRVSEETGINPKLTQLGVLANRVNTSRVYDQALLAQMREAWGENVLPVELYDRAAIKLAKDRPVWRTERGEGRSAAAVEMKNVCAYIYQRMGL